ncbi:asparagine synthetase B family protein [Sphingomonas sp. MMS24-J45]|uniref:asparagine synthetase B family protein n=1 Tax=Sphingomonas sp. MMS24-J45 TaxID=3238806 RepID=UPI00384DE2D3
MSALAAIWRQGSGASAAMECRRMLAPLKSLGVGAASIRSFNDVSFGAITNNTLPEDVFDHQPLVGGEGRYLFIADIRLDNRDDLAALLGIDHGQATRMSDADFALRAWEKWNLDCFNRIIGDWAIAIWDKQERQFVLARDPVGMRPLHYYRRDGLAAVATMPRGLHALPDIPRDIDHRFMAADLIMADRPIDHCQYRDIRRVVPGHIVRLDAKSIRIDRFWYPPETRLRLPSHQDYADAVRDVFDDAVRSRMRGRQSIATHLSGGLDSSAVTESAARQLGDTGRVTAYTSRPRENYVRDFGEPKGRFVDEWELASGLAAAHRNIDHVSIRATERSFLSALDHFSGLAERTAIAPGNLPWMVALNDRARADGHTVILSGQVGNLTFSHGGDLLYAQRLRRLELLKLRQDLRHFPARQAATIVRSAIVRLLPRPLQKKIRAVRHGSVDYGINPALHTRFAPSKEASGIDRRANLMRYFQGMDFGILMNAFLAGSGVEYRDPTADLRLLELCIAIPEEQFLFRGQGRALARTILAGHVPDTIRLETRRGLQGADCHEALKAEQADVSARIDYIAEDPILSELFEVSKLRDILATLCRLEQTGSHRIAILQYNLMRSLAHASFVGQARQRSPLVSDHAG